MPPVSFSQDNAMSLPPRPLLSIFGDDVEVEIPGLVTVRAGFLSEGLFDVAAGGDPDEEDLYEVEVQMPEGSLLDSYTFPKLLPSSSPSFSSSDSDLSDSGWEDEDEPGAAGQGTAERFVMVLAWELAHAHRSNWQRVCEAARGWDPWMIEDAFQRLPPEWTPEPLLPDED